MAAIGLKRAAGIKHAGMAQRAQLVGSNMVADMVYEEVGERHKEDKRLKFSSIAILKPNGNLSNAAVLHTANRGGASVISKGDYKVW